MSPTTIILSDASDAFSIDQDRFLQKDMSQLGGRFVQQRKILQVTYFNPYTFNVY